jgi:hypothetical protein
MIPFSTFMIILGFAWFVVARRKKDKETDSDDKIARNRGDRIFYRVLGVGYILVGLALLGIEIFLE